MPFRQFLAAVAALAVGCLVAACQMPAASDPGVRDPILSEGPVSKIVLSQKDFSATARDIEQAIEQRGLTLFHTVDHAANAERAGLNLPPSRVYIFGNPQAGTAFMNADPSMAFHLPMRMAVYETAQGEVRVAYQDIGAIARLHGLDMSALPIGPVSDTLDAIAGAGAFDYASQSGRTAP